MLDSTIGTYFWIADEGNPRAFLYHHVILLDGDHEIRLVVDGEKNPKSEGTKITITGAVVYGIK
jgi:hypothetical protein